MTTEFARRRLHSLLGLWLVLFLFEHLFVNSQAALLLGDNARGFVHLVNDLHNLPYLQVIEIVLLGVPLAAHAIWGIQALLKSKSNAHRTDGASPDMSQYGRNRAYTWQRLSSWVLLVGIVLHVAKFRFMEYPDSVNLGDKASYFVVVSVDKGLYTVASRLGATLYGPQQIAAERKELASRRGEETLVAVAESLPSQNLFDPQTQMVLTSAQSYEQKKAWQEVLERQNIGPNQVVAVSPDFGIATLLTVRDVFKNPIYGVLYTIFVLAACFHGLNGLWTFLITWGIVLKVSAQKMALKVSWTLMGLVTFLGLAAIWGTYFLNLKS